MSELTAYRKDRGGLRVLFCMGVAQDFFEEDPSTLPASSASCRTGSRSRASTCSGRGWSAVGS